MIKDYSVYEFSSKERAAFVSMGYSSICVITYLFYHSIMLAAVSGVLIYFVIPYIKEYMARKRLYALNIQFKDMLYSLSASVAAGRQMEEALIEAEENLTIIYKESDPIMCELRHMRISILENKESAKPLLKDFASRSGSEDINDFVMAYITCRNMGGDLEKMIVDAVDVLTEKMTIDRDIKVLISQKKTEGMIISLMPLAMLLGLNIMSYSYISVLYETLAGRLIMTGSLIVMCYGVFMMNKITKIRI